MSYVVDAIILLVVLYFIFFVHYWVHQLLRRFMPEELRQAHDDFYKGLFRFGCWLVGVKYKK